MAEIQKIGLGGGCHWCTEAVFQAVEGVVRVEQGYIASEGEAATFSEAVIVHYFPKKVNLEKLIDIHLHTHSATSNHIFRRKYRSAVYYFDPGEEKIIKELIKILQQEFSEELITQTLPFRSFKASRESLQNYYQKNPEAPFCKRYIEPKLKTLLRF